MTDPVPPTAGRPPMGWMALGGVPRESAGDLDPAAVLEALREVLDPEVGVNIVDLGLVYDVRVAAGRVEVEMTMTTPACPLGPYLTSEVEATLWRYPEARDVEVRVVWDPPWDPHAMMSDDAKRQLGWIE